MYETVLSNESLTFSVCPVVCERYDLQQPWTQFQVSEWSTGSLSTCCSWQGQIQTFTSSVQKCCVLKSCLITTSPAHHRFVSVRCVLHSYLWYTVNVCEVTEGGEDNLILTTWQTTGANTRTLSSDSISGFISRHLNFKNKCSQAEIQFVSCINVCFIEADDPKEHEVEEVGDASIMISWEKPLAPVTGKLR